MGLLMTRELRPERAKTSARVQVPVLALLNWVWPLLGEGAFWRTRLRLGL